jgi:hydrogenase nickel incorporation protein HypB
MCQDCGCEAGNAKAMHHVHGHTHDHPHGHTHDHTHDGLPPHEHHHDHHEERRVLDLSQAVLAENDRIAHGNATMFQQRGITALNLISSPGSGKTTLLEKTLDAFRGELPCAVLTGDQQTDHDARRLKDRGAPVAQIETHSSCHLDAKRIQPFLHETLLPETRLLFIENVGNLVCPAAFQLGETFKIALLSTTEGEDKPLKYPVLFSLAPVVILTKMDLAPYLDWQLHECVAAIRRVRPDAQIFPLSAKTGEGMDRWLDYLRHLCSL